MNRIKLILFLTILLISCKSVEYVPVETIKTEYINIHTIDTLIQNTTTTIKEKGDTVYVEVDRYVYKYRDRIDTCVVNDTTVTYVDKIEYVEVNRIKDWQSLLMVFGGILIGLVVFKIIKIFKK